MLNIVAEEILSQSCVMFHQALMYFSCLDHFCLLLMQALIFCNRRENQLHDIDVRSCYQTLSTGFVKVYWHFTLFQVVIRLKLLKVQLKQLPF